MDAIILSAVNHNQNETGGSSCPTAVLQTLDTCDQPAQHKPWEGIARQHAPGTIFDGTRPMPPTDLFAGGEGVSRGGTPYALSSAERSEAEHTGREQAERSERSGVTRRRTVQHALD